MRSRSKSDHIRVAEIADDELVARGQIRFGVGQQLRGALEELRMAQLDVGVVEVEPQDRCRGEVLGRGHRGGACAMASLVHQKPSFEHPSLGCRTAPRDCEKRHVNRDQKCGRELRDEAARPKRRL
jgi:hypothetical protein